MPEPRIALNPQFYYHIYNHAVGKENLFTTASDYSYFLTKLKEYISPVCDLFAYCLMPNHFHLIVRMKDESEVKKIISSKANQPVDFELKLKTNNYYLSDSLSKMFSNFFNTYAKHYNYKTNRRGSLFKRAFMRKEITDLKYLRQLICYVHRNPVEAGFANNLDEWKYSSFKAIVSESPTLLLRDEVISLFDDLENFRYCHLKNSDLQI